MSSWKILGIVPIDHERRDAIRNKGKLDRRWISSKNKLSISQLLKMPVKHKPNSKTKVKAIILKPKKVWKEYWRLVENPKFF